MILQALYDLAEEERLVEDPDYEWKPIGFVVELDQEGTLLGIRCTYTEPPQTGKKKPKAVPKRMLVPRCGARTSGDRAFFLHDKAEYVFGIDPDGSRAAEKLSLRAELFREEVVACAKVTQSAAVRAVATFLENLVEGHQPVGLPEGCASNDLFAFVVRPEVDTLVSDLPDVRTYWKALRSESGTGEKAVCLVLGQELEPARLFPGVKKLPGGSTSGVGLVSYNSKAFESYGWSGNENGPISRDAAEASATAINRLLDTAYPRPDAPDETLPVRHLRLSADTVVTYWAKGQQGAEVCDVFASIVNPSPEQVPEVYRSLWRGIPPAVDDPSAFYALTLTGTQGRAIVRDWFESTVGEVLANVARYFSEIDIVRNTPKPKMGDLPPQIPLGQMLESLAVFGKRENIPAPLSAKFVRAALQGVPYPLAALQRAIERMRAEIGSTEWSDIARRDARAAIIKAVLTRNMSKEVSRAMNPNNDEPGYVLGQLLAVFERLQTLALDNPNASVVDRYFSGASASPKSVFVRLYKNARHHVRKALDDSKTAGTAFLLDRIVDALTAKFGVQPGTADYKAKMLHPEKMGFPAFLPLDQQGQFMLGYHQMRKWIWMSKEERRQWEAEHPDAPRAYKWSKEKEAVEQETGAVVDV